MAASSNGGSSSATSGRRRSGHPVPLCPFCKTRTVVERISRTTKNPDVPFYSCTNGDWGSGKSCDFFMWKPEASPDSNAAADVMASIRSVHEAVLHLTNQQSAKPSDTRCILLTPWWMKVAGLAVVIVNFIAMAKILSSSGTCSY